MKKVLTVSGLSCASCASMIENKLNNIDEINNAVVDSISSRIILEIKENTDIQKIINKINIIAIGIEPDFYIIDNFHEKDADDLQDNIKKEVLRIALGSIIFAVVSIFNFSSFIELLLYLASYIVIGGEVLLRAGKNILKGQIFDENFLMTIATIGAFSIGEFPEGVAVMLFYQIGELFQDSAVNKSKRSITSLMDIRPDFANLKSGDDIKKVSPDIVKVGDTIVVKPGERIPLDGIIINGNSTVDTSSLTGESLPKEVAPGDSILSGMINKNGLLTIKVDKVFSESTVSKILDLVQNASSNKAPTENFITKFARYYTPIVVFSALALAIIPPLVIEGATFSQWIYRALAFLVVSCPCALVISVPLGFFGGIGGASKEGILVKGGNFLEALNNVDTVVFDKTGTLTKGTFRVTKTVPKNNYTSEDLITYAAYGESHSSHPIAISVLKEYGKKVDIKPLNYEELPGHGIIAEFPNGIISIGNSKLMNQLGVSYDQVELIGTILHVALNNIYVGYIVISDEIKEDSFNAIKSLKKLGIKSIVMLTGDHERAGNHIAKELKLDKVYSELLPHEKVSKLEEIYNNKKNKGKVIYVGDGINDAPVLARSDIGIAMGGIGSDAAIEAADIVIMNDEPSKVATAIKIANRTKNIVMQNIVFALGIKIIILILVALGLGTMWEAVFGDVGVALLAVLNSMRAMKVPD